MRFKVCFSAVALTLVIWLFHLGTATAVPPGQNGPIAFQVGSGTSGGNSNPGDIYLMGPNGENPHLAIPDAERPIAHPGGKGVVIRRRDGVGSELRDLQGNLISDPIRARFRDIFDLAEDGRTGIGIYRNELVTVDLMTGAVTGIGITADAEAGEQLFEPHLTPDGRKVVYGFNDEAPSGLHRTRIFAANIDGSDARSIYEGSSLGRHSVSPNGTRVMFTKSDRQPELWMVGIDGLGATRIAQAESGYSYVNPTFSPDGSMIAFVKWAPSGKDEEEGIYVMDVGGGGERQLISTPDFDPPVLLAPAWLPKPNTLSMTLEARRVDDGDDIFDVVMRLKAGNQSPVEDLRFTDPETIGSSAAGFPAGQQSQVTKLSGPDQPIPARLEINEERTLVWTYKIEKPGRVALFSEVAARAVEDGIDEIDSHTVIADSIPSAGTDGEITPQLAMLGAMDNWLIESYKAWMAGNRAEARRIVKWAKKNLSPKERRVWLGAKKGIKVSPAEHAFAARANIAPELAAAMLPNPKLAKRTGMLEGKPPSQGKLAQAFFKGYGKAIAKEGKKDLGHAWKEAKHAVLSGVAVFNYMTGQASPEERAQVEAEAAITWNLAADKAQIDWESAEGKAVLARYGHSMYKDHMGVPVTPIRAEDVAAMWNDITLQTPDLKAQLAQEKIRLKNVYRNDDILKAVERHGALTGEESYPWAKLGAETLVGAGVEKLVTKTITKSTGLTRLAKGTGEVTPKGKPVKKSKVKIAHEPIGKTGARPSIRDTVLSRRNFDGETLDELANIGGVPLREAEIQRQIIEEIEIDFGLPPGQLGLALKPSSPLRKANSVAKFELAKVKTGKPIHERLGMDPRALSEPTFFKPTKPQNLPEWNRLTTAEQQDLNKTYKKALKEYRDWTSGKPKDPDLAKLSKATQRVDGKQLKKPVTIDIGQGRKVKALFEEVPVPGTDTIRIRVKYYEVDGIVFLNSKKARPMGPDLDAVAIYDAKAGARFSDRQLETQILRAYRKKVAERVKGGERFHGAEHGMTLIMDDVSAGPNGSVGFLMQYGIPYLPEPAAYAFARRIEPFVEMLAEEIMGNVGKPGSGAFGQKLVNVTSHNVYYGKLPLEAW